MWEHAQSEFVDDPVAAVNHADVLVQEVMSVRGYPVGLVNAPEPVRTWGTEFLARYRRGEPLRNVVDKVRGY